MKNNETTTKRLELILPLIFTLAYTAFYIIRPGNLSMFKFWGSMLLSFALYALTSYKKAPDPDRVLPLFLLAIGVQILHFTEEFISQFYIRWFTEITHKEPFSVNNFVMNQMTVYFLFIIAAIGIYKKWKITQLLVWYMIIMMLLVNAIQHPILAIATKGYFPGLYTSFFGIILGPVLFKRMWEVRGKKRNMVKLSVQE